MPSGFQADTAQVAQTSNLAASYIDSIIQKFQQMNNDTRSVLSMSRGSMISTATAGLAGLEQDRNKLTLQMQRLSEQLKQGGQGMTSQSESGSAAVKAQVQPTLTTPLNSRTV